MPKRQKNAPTKKKKKHYDRLNDVFDEVLLEAKEVDAQQAAIAPPPVVPHFHVYKPRRSEKNMPAKVSTKHLKSGDIMGLLLQRGVDLANRTLQGEPIDSVLPLEVFDDEAFEVYATPQHWLAKGVNKHGEQKGVPCRGLRADQQGDLAWVYALVTDYNADTNKYVLEWGDTGEKAELHRLRICFRSESAENFANRVLAALVTRANMMQQMRYNLCVNSMPTEDSPAIKEKQLARIAALTATDSTGNSGQRLVNEVQLDYARTMNKVIFDVYYRTHGEHFPGIAVPKPNQIPPAPQLGCETLDMAEWMGKEDPPTYTEQSENFGVATLYDHNETYSIMEHVSMESMKLQELSLYVYSFDSPQRLAEFADAQATHLKAIVEYLNDRWISNIKSHAEADLKRMDDKTQWNITETSTERYNESKLKHLFMVITFKMQDSLRFLEQDSIRRFAAMLAAADAAEHALGLLDIVVDAKTNNVKLKVTPETYAAKINGAFSTALQMMQRLVQVERRVMNRLFWSHTPMLAAVTEDEPLVVDTVKTFSEYLEASCKPVNEYLETYKVYDEFLAEKFEDVRDELIASCTDEDGHVDHHALLVKFKGLVANHRKQAADLKDEIQTEKRLGPFLVTSSEVLDLLVCKHNDYADRFLTLFAENLSEGVQTITKKYDGFLKKLNSKITNIEQLSELEQLMSEIPSLSKEVDASAEKLLSHFDTLTNFGFSQSIQDFTARWNLFGYPKTLVDKIESLKENNITLKEEYLDTMLQEQKVYEEDIKALDTEVKGLSRFSDPERVTETAEYIRKVKAKIAKYKADSILFNSREALFENDITEYSLLGSIARNFEPYNFLWDTADLWKTNHDKWMHGKFTDIDAEKLDNSVQDYYRKLQKSEKLFTRNKVDACAEIANTIRKQVEEFKPLGPMVVALRNPGMRQRHWHELSLKINKVITVDDNFTLTDIIDLGIAEEEEMVRKIGEQAGKEYQIEKALDNMEAEWEGIDLELEPYRETGTSIFKGADEIIQMLDEQITMTQAMSFSSFKKPFEERINTWDKRLSTVSEVVDEWLAVQRSWLYLQPIFDSDDIKKQLPTESKRFLTVDKTWRQTIHNALKNPAVINFCDSEKLLEKFLESSKFLDMVQKGLSDYLETKRAGFSRFYFLSNDELLEILSETKDPKKVQPHLKKCFEAIAKVKFDDRLQITHMCSREKEEIEFPNKINPVNRNVEEWMTELEAAMRLSVKQAVHAAIIDYTRTPRTQWMQTWPGMCVINCSQNHWTRQIEEALTKEGTAGAQKMLDQQIVQLDDMVVCVRGKLTSLARKSVGALAVMDVHARDVTKTLVEEGVSDKGAFEWISQLRYYWMLNNGDGYQEEEVGLDSINPEGDLVGIMVTSKRVYAYEYLGNSFRLVITPLTDKCYLTLMGALEQILGGAPAGPAGTGKTETTKDLAKALAKQCVVFNCSDGMDYKMTGKFFKGLASCGAWCCFDEFNRIGIEVLSVIAQQITTLQQGVFNNLDRIIFEETDIKLDGAFAVFITMNPGYAGRTDLPDNLKALFRPVAMMVPDYGLIGEIMLFAYGYSASRSCAKKMVATFRLCSEQLSSQDHYDYGMRAVKTVIVAAGNLKRAEPERDEEELMLRGLMDVNLPKFLSHDLPLFEGIMSDLFPGKSKPEVDYGCLMASIRHITAKKKLQPVPFFIAKVVQLYEMIVVRHGLMVVGPTGGGKSSNIRVLQDALTLLDTKGITGARYEHVHVKYINPKSITMGQLYGSFDPNTHEWQDGVLANMIRICVKMDNSELKWVLFDGPVDTLWIESMNTVLDDNKKLCLNSGEIVPLSAPMTMMFEPADLAVASPATVSRCGMIYMEPHALGFECQNYSWLTLLPSCFTRTGQGIPNKLRFLLDSYLQPTMAYLRRYLHEPVPTVDNNLAASLRKLLDCHFMQFRPAEGEDEVSGEAVQKVSDTLDGVFMFALIWSVGTTVDGAGRKALNEFLRREMAHNAFAFPMPEEGSVYDYYFKADGKGRWVPWMDTVDPYEHNAKKPFNELIIPTADTVRYTYLLATLVTNDMNVLVCGPTGTGKTVNVQNWLQNEMDKKYVPMNITFSAQTSANMTQDLIDGKCEKRRKGVFGPMAGKKFVIFVDDCNMPQREIFGAQPPIELLRQLLCVGGWYDRKTLRWRSIIDSIVVNACGPPGGGRNPVTPRYFRHFNVVGYAAMSDDVMQQIFFTILEGFLEPFPAECQKLAAPICRSSISMYNYILSNLLPTPARPHYEFNLRDLGKVVQGVLMCDVKKTPTGVQLARTWVHEAQRVFMDRLVSQPDCELFIQLLSDNLTNELKLDPKKVMPDPYYLVFGDYMIPGADPRVYCEVDTKELQTIVEEYLGDYNAESKTPMDLVMFKDALKHVSRISRIIRQPMGNALLLGIGGSGRQSLTRLATFMAEYTCFQVEIAKGYGPAEWRENLRQCLLKGGLDDKPIVFLFNDTQIVFETMLEDVNNILNSGDVPNLYGPEEMDQIMNTCRIDCQRKRIPATKLNIFNQYILRVRRNIHVVLCMSPIGEAFRTRLRMFPSLVNCCTIDWFSEWPDEALESVGRSFMLVEDMALGKDFDGVVQMFRNIHQQVARSSVKFRDVLDRHNYVTPTSYLELLSTYKKVIASKREEVGSLKDKLQGGLNKIEYASQEVAKLQKEIVALEPVLKKTSQEVAEMMVQIQKDQGEANITKGKVEEIEVVASKQAAESKAIADDAQKDLDLALPALDEAVACLSLLKKADIVEVGAMKSPPSGVKLTMEVSCLMFDVKPNLVKDPASMGKKIKDYWGSAKKNLLNDPNGFLAKLVEFDKDNISDRKAKRLKIYVDNPDFTPAQIKKASQACTAVCMWARAMYTYNTVAKEVEPKKARLKEAQDSLAVTMGTLNDAKAQLAAVNAKLKDLEAGYNKAVADKEELSAKMQLCNDRLKRADVLINGLAGEKTRWAVTVKTLVATYNNLVGDCLITAGTIAYLGAFTPEFRQNVIKELTIKLKELDVTHTPDCSLMSVLADPVAIRSWNLYGLPPDNHSIENGIIMNTARRWPLFVDPQTQANAFVKKMAAELAPNGFEVIKLTDPNFLRPLENGVRFGRWIILENVLETLDAALEPLLLQQKFKQAGTDMIKVGDSILPYSDDFRFFITTKLPNPHYAPEVCVKVSLLNFTITVSGLEDQLLTQVIKKEKPELGEAKDQLVIQNAKMAKELKQLEDMILHLLSNSKGNILDDIELIDNLALSKKTSNEINVKLKEAAVTEKEIDETREKYRPVAFRGSILYFCICDLSTIDPMYQYSLQWYINLFVRACDEAEDSNDVEARKKSLIDFFTFSLYTNICRSLFEKHKPMFSFMLTIKVLQGYNKIDNEEWRFLISGVGGPPQEAENPAEDWIVARMFKELQSLTPLPAFNGLLEDICGNPSAWRGYFDSATPHTEKLPGKWETQLNSFQKMCVLRCFRIDKIMPSIMLYCIEKMGKRFVEPPPFNLAKAYNDSTLKTPLIFVLTAGSDPTKMFRDFAEEMRCKYDGLSLGQGQDKKAERMIQEGLGSGTWVYLQNCHLYVSWMVTLEQMVENFQETANQSFRLWLTSMPSSAFPVAVLQNGVKMTLEPPKGLKANLKNAYFKLDDDKLNVTAKPGVYKKLLFALSFFHAGVQDRRKYGPLGWNCPYEFNNTDLEISMAQLERFLDTYEEIPYKVLHFLISYVNYGGRVTDYIDLRTIHVLLLDLFNPNIVKDDFKFSESGIYYSIPFDDDRPHESYMNYIETLPLNPDPEAFGLHQNADIICAETEANECLTTLLSLQPKKQSGEGKSREEVIADIAADIQDRLTPVFDTEAISMAYPLTYSECMNTVLLQECMRYNNVLRVMHRTLPQLKKALKGLVTMSQELEAMANALYVAAIPEIWSEAAYPSLKPLGPWVNELMDRLGFLNSWIDVGIPDSFWVPGFYFPQAFFTGARQNYARKHKCAIDTVDFDFLWRKEVEGSEITEKPEDGVYIYGLWLEGARWNPETKSIDDSLSKQLYTKAPLIHLDPKPDRKSPTTGIYRCPVYKTLLRRGTLSTTGHSTNFVMWIEAPSNRADFSNNLNCADQDVWIRAGVAGFCALRY